MLKSPGISTSFKSLRLQGSGIKVFFYLGNTFLKQGKFSQASRYYQRALQSINQAGALWPDHYYYEQGYLINHDHRFIYCPIPKVACSSFKKYMVSLSHLENKEEIINLPQRLFHSYISHTLTLSASQSYKEAIDLLNESKYFKFAFVRNPWERLTSAYLNKFVSPISHNQSNLPLSKEVIENIYRKNDLKANYEESITFRQFVDYIMVTEDKDLDGHWQPQYLFLGDTQFDFIGRFENLEKDFAYLQKKLGLSSSLPWSNKSQINDDPLDANKSDLNRHFSDYYPKELSQLSHAPDYRDFYTPDLIEMVKKRYAKDIELFEYEF